MDSRIPTSFRAERGTLNMYIKNTEGKSLSYNYDYKQVFAREPKRSHGLPEYVIVTEFWKSDEASRRVGIEILLYLRTFGFATRDMLAAMLEVKGLDTSVLDGVLFDYANKYLVNYFILAQYDMGEIPEDAEKFYCLDSSGIHVLTHFSSLDSVSWLSTDCLRSVELITKYVATGYFNTALAKLKGKNLIDFDALYNAYIGRRNIRFSGRFSLMNGYTSIPYVLEVVRDFDLPGIWEKKCIDQIGPYAREKYWARDFGDEPTYVLVCETEDVALRAAETLQRQIGDASIRIVLDAFLAGDTTAVYDYDKDQRALVAPCDNLFTA